MCLSLLADFSVQIHFSLNYAKTFCLLAFSSASGFIIPILLHTIMSVNIKHQCAVQLSQCSISIILKGHFLFIAGCGLCTNFLLGFIKSSNLCLFVYHLEMGLGGLLCCHQNIKQRHLLGVSYRGHLHLIGNPTERETQWLPEK